MGPSSFVLKQWHQWSVLREPQGVLVSRFAWVGVTPAASPAGRSPFSSFGSDLDFQKSGKPQHGEC